MKLKSLIIIACLLPSIAMAQYLGRSEYDPVTGGYRYYSAPNAAHDNAMGVQSLISGMRLLNQSIQFNRQHELQVREHELRMRELRERNERSERAHNDFMREIQTFKEHRDAGRISQEEVDEIVRSLLNTTQSTAERADRLSLINGTIQ